MLNCTRDEGGPFEFGNQVLISSHRKLLSSKAMAQSSCDGVSRMNREVHVRFCEGLGVKFPGPTRQLWKSPTRRMGASHPVPK